MTVLVLFTGVLSSGGRVLHADTPTAPEGVFFHSRAGGRVQVNPDQNCAEDAGFKRQGCLKGMGKRIIFKKVTLEGFRLCSGFGFHFAFTHYPDASIEHVFAMADSRFYFKTNATHTSFFFSIHINGTRGKWGHYL